MPPLSSASGPENGGQAQTGLGVTGRKFSQRLGNYNPPPLPLLLLSCDSSGSCRRLKSSPLCCSLVCTRRTCSSYFCACSCDPALIFAFATSFVLQTATLGSLSIHSFHGLLRLDSKNSSNLPPLFSHTSDYVKHASN